MAMKRPGLLLAALLSIILGGTARADIITWTLNGVTFDDGGTASGFFRVNTVTHQVTAWDITTTAGSLLPGYHYSSALPNQNFSNYSTNTLLVDDPSSNEIEFAFNSSFGTATANNTLFPAGSYEYEPSTGNQRTPSGAADGTLANPGPLPGGGLLSYLIVGFGGLAAYRRKAFAWAKSTVAASRTRLRRRHGYGCLPA